MNNDKYVFNYIYLLVADAEVAKALKTPGNLQELYTYVSYMKDKSGINGWTEQQHLLQVKSLIDPFPVTEICGNHCKEGNFIVIHIIII